MRIREILDASGAFALRYVYEFVHFGRVYVVSDVFFLFCLSRALRELRAERTVVSIFDIWYLVFE